MIKETAYIHGPFVVIVTHQTDHEEGAYPMVVAPEGGFPTKGEARQYVQDFEASMVKHGDELCFDWYIAQISSLNAFTRYCSF